MRAFDTGADSCYITKSLAESDISSHSGLTNSYLPSMMFLRRINCLRCQNGGNPTSLNNIIVINQILTFATPISNLLVNLQSVHYHATGPSKREKEKE